MNLKELSESSAWNDEIELSAFLEHCSDLYYNEGNSPISDAVFDACRKRLETLNPDHPTLAKIGAPVNSDGMERHKIPMGSLDNVNDEEEFTKWWNKVNPQEIVVQYKYDGLSLSLDYEEGNLVRGLLRGDGVYGENKTENICNCYHNDQINNLNERFTGSIRGEGVIYKEDFNEQNFPGESNPRNSAVGAIRKENSPRAKWVRVACYDLVNCKEFETEVEKLQYMEHLGIPTAEYKVFNNPEDVINFYNETEIGRPNMDYLVDGLVLKINNISRQKELGSHNNRSKWARAFKFATMTAETTLRKIILSIGHTGNVIPTAEYDPIMIEGKCFRHALLDNFNMIEKHQLGIGDKIEIEITGDVIPKLHRVVEHHYKCPECGFTGLLSDQQTHHGSCV